MAESKNNLGSYENYPIIKAGYLYKQSKYMKEWRKRWFVLTSYALYTFKDNFKLKDPTETILLSECTTIKSSDDETNKENSFVIYNQKKDSKLKKIESNNRTFYIYAESNQDKEQWIGAIGKFLNNFVYYFNLREINGEVELLKRPL